MHMYDIEYNGKVASDMKILVKERPDIPAPKKKSTAVEVAGRDGNLIESDGTYEDITIVVAFNYITNPDTWAEVFRTARRWLLSSGSHELKLLDDSGYFYKVKSVEISTNERTSLRIGNFTASFLCEPYQYVDAGKMNYSLDSVKFNHYEVSHPQYIISGDGVCELYANGNIVKITVDDYITVDTERMMAYKDDVLQNTSVAGEYEDLYLMSGKNELSVTDGFEIKVIPNWRSV